MTQAAEPRPIGELISQLADQTTTLVREEVSLATLEMAEKAKAAARKSATIVAGGVIALGGCCVVLAGIVLLLSTLMAPWLAAFITGAVTIAVGSILSLAAYQAFRRIDPVPRVTALTMKENRAWLQNQLRT